MPPYASNPLNEISSRLQELKSEIKHVQNEYEAALLEDQPVAILKAFKERITSLKRKHNLYTEVAKQRTKK